MIDFLKIISWKIYAIKQYNWWKICEENIFHGTKAKSNTAFVERKINNVAEFYCLSHSSLLLNLRQWKGETASKIGTYLVEIHL